MRKYQGKLTVIYADFRVIDSSNPSVKRQERDFEKSESLLIYKRLTSKWDLIDTGAERALWHRSLPPPVADSGRRSVGNCKERQDAATMQASRVETARRSVGNRKERLRDLFGSTNHYDTKGHKVGRTDPGLFGTQNHRDERGRQIGESTPGLWGTTDTEIKS